MEAQLLASASQITALLEDVEKYAHAKSDLVSERQRVIELESALFEARRKLSELDQQRSRDLRDHVKSRDSFLRRIAHQASGRRRSFADKAARKEQTQFDQFRAVNEQKEEKDRLDGELDNARRRERRLERLAKKHTTVQIELDTLYDTIFSGPTPQYPEEDPLEIQAEEALREYDSFRLAQEKEEQALDLLQQTSARIRKALAHLECAGGCVEPDMLGGGSTVLQMMNGAQTAAAQKEWQAGVVLHAQARAASGSVGQMPHAHVNAQALATQLAYNGGVKNMNVWRTEQEIKRAAAELKGQVEPAQERVDRGKKTMEEVAGQLDRARTALQEVRTDIFRRVTGVAPPPLSARIGAPQYSHAEG